MKKEEKQLLYLIGEFKEFKKNQEVSMEDLKSRVGGVSDRIDEMESKFDTVATIMKTLKVVGVCLGVFILAGVEGLVKLKWW